MTCLYLFIYKLLPHIYYQYCMPLLIYWNSKHCPDDSIFNITTQNCTGMISFYCCLCVKIQFRIQFSSSYVLERASFSIKPDIIFTYLFLWLNRVVLPFCYSTISSQTAPLDIMDWNAFKRAVIRIADPDVRGIVIVKKEIAIISRDAWW